MLEKTIGKEWKIYTTSKTLPKLLAHLVPYESPKLGFLRRFFRKLDYMLEFSRLNRLSLWFFKGAILIAVTTTPKETN